MNNNLVVLLKVLWIEQLKLNTLRGKSGGQKKSVIVMIYAFVILSVMLAVYSYALGYGLGSIGLSRIIPGYGVTVIALLSLVITLLQSNGVLFGFKDYEMLVALPVRTATLIASRFLHMYTINAAVSLVVMVAMGIAYAGFAPTGVQFWIMWLIGALLASLIPTMLAAMLGALIVFFASRFRYTQTLVTVLSFGFVLGLMGMSFAFGDGSEDLDKMQMANLGQMLADQIHRMYPVSAWFEKGVVDNNLGAFLLFCGLSVGWYLLFIALLSLRYKAINTAIMTHQTRSDYTFTASNIRSPLAALYHKELKRFFSSTVYVLNTGMGAMMALFMTIGLFVTGPDKWEEITQIPGVADHITNYLPFVFSMILSMTCTTSVALSLEGKNLWILTSSPIPVRTILNSKILVNLTLLLPNVAVFALLMNLKFRPDFLTGLTFLLTPLAYACFVPVWGIFINLKLPNYDWQTEVQVVKQGLSSMAGMFGGMIFGLLPIGFIALLGMEARLVALGAAAVMAVLTGMLYRRVGRTERL